MYEDKPPVFIGKDTEDSTIPCILYLQVADVRSWLYNAEPGENITYFRGVLSRATGENGSPDVIRHLKAVAEELWDAGRAGYVHLVQKKNGLNDYSYMAIKTIPQTVRLRK